MEVLAGRRKILYHHLLVVGLQPDRPPTIVALALVNDETQYWVQSTMH